MSIIETMEDSSIDLNVKSEDQSSSAEKSKDGTSTSSIEITETLAETAIATIAEKSETSLTIVKAIIEELIQTSISIAIATIAKTNRPSTSSAEISETTAITTTVEKDQISIVTAIIDEIIQISTSDASCEKPKQISMNATPSVAETCEEPTSTMKISTESNQVWSSTIPSATEANIFTATATCADPDPTSNFSTTSTYAESVNTASAKMPNTHPWNLRYPRNWPRNATFHPPTPYFRNTIPCSNYPLALPMPFYYFEGTSFDIPNLEPPCYTPVYPYTPLSKEPVCDWLWHAPCPPYLEQPSFVCGDNVPYFQNYYDDPMTQEAQIVQENVTNTDDSVLINAMSAGNYIRNYSYPRRVKSEPNIKVCDRESTEQQRTRSKRKVEHRARSRGKKIAPRDPSKPRERREIPKHKIFPDKTSCPITLDMRELLSNAKTKHKKKTSSTQQPDRSKQKPRQKKTPRKKPTPELTPREDTKNERHNISSELVDKQEPEIGNPINECPIQKTNEVLVDLPEEHNENDKPESSAQENNSTTVDSYASVLDEKSTELKENKDELNEIQKTVTLVSKVDKTTHTSEDFKTVTLVSKVDNTTQTSEDFEIPEKTRDQSTQINLDLVDQETEKYYPEKAETKNEPSGAGKKFVEANPVKNNKTEEQKTEKNDAEIPRDKENKTEKQTTENKKTEYKNKNTKYNKPTTLSYADVLKKRK